MRGRSTVIIAHQLKAMERYNRILVLEKGTIWEQYLNGELKADNGLYRRMWSE